MADDPAFSSHWPYGHRTRDGRAARIICWNRTGYGQPIVALVHVALDDPREVILSFCENGAFPFSGARGDSLDLVNVPDVS